MSALTSRPRYSDYSFFLGLIMTSLMTEHATPRAQNPSAIKWFLLYLTFRKMIESIKAEGIENTCKSMTEVIEVNSKAFTTTKKDQYH